MLSKQIHTKIWNHVKFNTSIYKNRNYTNLHIIMSLQMSKWSVLLVIHFNNCKISKFSKSLLCLFPFLKKNWCLVILFQICLLFYVLAPQHVQLCWLYQLLGHPLVQPSSPSRALQPQIWHNSTKPSSTLSSEGVSHTNLEWNYALLKICQTQYTPSTTTQACPENGNCRAISNIAHTNSIAPKDLHIQSIDNNLMMTTLCTSHKEFNSGGH